MIASLLLSGIFLWLTAFVASASIATGYRHAIARRRNRWDDRYDRLTRGMQ